MKLSKSDRSALIRLASGMSVGNPERRAILSSLKNAALHRVIYFELDGPLPKKFLPTPYDLMEGGAGVSVTRKSRDHYIIRTKNRDATDSVLDWIEENNIAYAID